VWSSMGVWTHCERMGHLQCKFQKYVRHHAHFYQINLSHHRPPSPPPYQPNRPSSSTERTTVQSMAAT
jgi:hypothetical protein